MPISITCDCGRYFETAEANAGGLARCPECGRERTVPKPMLPPEVLLLPELPEPSDPSRKAIASLVLGVLFFFACLSGVPAILLGWRALREIELSKGRLRGRGMAVAGIVLGLIGCLFTIALLLPATRASREAARRASCVNNLKQLGLAIHNYHDANGCLPPAAITDKNGRPLLSWRVAILPYLDPSALYLRFHLDEPWDSPHNRTLVDAMPSCYACPSDTTRKPGMTGYQVVIGPNTAFTPDFKPLPFQDMTDGLSHTLLIGESRHGVPWTKPEDLHSGAALPLAGLGSHHGHHNNGFNAAFADGAVRFLKTSILPGVLGAILTRNGKEAISPDHF